MRRRELIALGSAAVAILPLAVRAQQSNRMRVIGILDVTYEDAYRKVNIGAFEEAFAKLG